MSLLRQDGTLYGATGAGHITYPSSGYRILVVRAGGVASASSSGTTISLYTGHGHQAGAKIMVGTSLGGYSGIYTVSTVASGSIVMSGGTYNVAAGDTILNLGPDSGADEPNWDGSTATIYSTPDTTTAVTGAIVSVNGDGSYGYWHDGSTDLWEVVLAPSSTAPVAGVNVDVYTSEHLGQVYQVAEYATAGTGTSSDPWIGWEGAFTTIPTGPVKYVFGPGHYTKQSTIALPVDRTSPLVIEGYGAVVKLTSGQFPLLAVASHSDYAVLKNIIILGLAIDGDSIAGDTSVVTPVLVGPSTATRLRLNYQAITIRDIRMFNVSETGRTTGISIATSHTSDSEATQTYAQDILMEGIRQEGGKNGIVCTAGTDSAGNSCNHVLRRITIKKHYHAAQSTPTAFAIGANVQLGADGIVEDCLVTDCYWKNSPDICIEVDNPQGVVVSNCVAEDPWVVGFYATNFSTLTNVNKNHILFDGCVTRISSSLTATANNTGNGFKVAQSNASAPVVGKVVFQNCKYENYSSSLHWAYNLTGYYREVLIDGGSIYAPNMNLTGAGGTQAIIYVESVHSGALLKIRDVYMNWTIDTGTYTIGLTPLRLRNATSLTVDVDGLYSAGTFSNNVDNGTFYFVVVGDDSATTHVIKGTMRRLVVSSLTTPSSTLNKSNGVYVSQYLAAGSLINFVDCDFSALPDGARYLFLESSADLPYITYRNVHENGTNQIVGKTTASAATVTLPTGCDFVTISGTADITSITASWPGRVVTLLFSGTAATTGLTDGSNLKLTGNFAYTPDDTITLRCDGTNWYEVSRSAN